MTKTILIVDDDESLSKLVSICLEESGEKVNVMHVETGEEALDYLSGKGRYSDRRLNPVPAVILLDLGLPMMSGMELLKRIKTSDELSSIPVAVLTAMESRGDIKRVFNQFANSCIIKPFGLDEMKKVLNSFAAYWLRYNRLPEEKTH